MNFKKIIYIIILPILLLLSSCAKDSKYIEYLDNQVYQCDFDGYEYDDFTFEDTNKDNYIWKVENVDSYSYDDECIIYNSSGINADDWAYTPDGEIFLETNKVYSLSFSTKCSYDSKPERIEVKCGQSHSSSSMLIDIMDATVISSESWKKYTNSFSVMHSGYYYIGFHAISYANKRKLYVDNIKVTKIN